MRRCLPKHMIQASRRVPWVVKEGCVKANCRDSTKGRKDSMLVHMGEPPCPCELQSLQGYEDPPFLSPSCYILWTFVHINLRKFSYEKLKQKLKQGQLIHGDETKVKLKSESGYVWAFTNMEEVVYAYT